MAEPAGIENIEEEIGRGVDAETTEVECPECAVTIRGRNTEGTEARLGKHLYAAHDVDRRSDSTSDDDGNSSGSTPPPKKSRVIDAPTRTDSNGTSDSTGRDAEKPHLWFGDRAPRK